MSYQGKKSIPHITVSGPGTQLPLPSLLCSRAGKGVRRELSGRGRAVPRGWRRGAGMRGQGSTVWTGAGNGALSSSCWSSGMGVILCFIYIYMYI